MENGQGESKVNNKNDEAKTDNSTSEATEDTIEKSTEKSGEKSTEETVQKACADEADDEIMRKIKEQVEYYFGDVNLSRDKFLQKQMKLDDNWIPMTVMLKFKRLAALSENVDLILKALESSEMIEISPNKKEIRRAGTIPEFTEKWKQEQQARTVYMKGFPLKDMTIEKFKEFLKPYDAHENIVMRKYSDKSKQLHFKGSIFVQFKTLEDAEAFMARKSVKYGDTELIRKWAVDYATEKLAEKESWKKKKMDNEMAKQMKTNEGGKQNSDAPQNDDKEEGEDNGLKKGSVFHFKDVPQGCTREKIKDWLTETGANIAYIDFKKGDQEGYVRLRDENSAKPFLEKTEGKTLVIDDVTLAVRVIEGTEEQEYLAKVKEDMKTAKDRYLSKGKHQSKKGRNAQRNTKKRRNSPPTDGPNAKKVARN